MTKNSERRAAGSLEDRGTTAVHLDVHLAFKRAKTSVRDALMSSTHGDLSVTGPEMRKSGT
ncbi:hypothetical protein [Jiangella alkaliphila]|uniref:Uncharacterized protein n=1 Tax=Jiangella alkaliphila TaxID=419479 RepID=A0A1H2LIY4_9ACTN|nr:hypothetical protein [Jiangella alkaliphila]SDU80977.1 hypothetical protein SAMN04488563_6251 [Jiangella alkaliphila]